MNDDNYYRLFQTIKNPEGNQSEGVVFYYNYPLQLDIPTSAEEFEKMKIDLLDRARSIVFTQCDKVINSDKCNAEDKVFLRGLVDYYIGAERSRKGNVIGYYTSTATMDDLQKICDELAQRSMEPVAALELIPIVFDLPYNVVLTKENADRIIKYLNIAIDYVEKTFLNCHNILCVNNSFDKDELDTLLYIKKNIANAHVYVRDRSYNNGYMKNKIINGVEVQGNDKNVVYELENLIAANMRMDKLIEEIKSEDLTPLEAYLKLYDFVANKVYQSDQLLVDERSFIGAMTTDSIVCAGFALLLTKGAEKLNIDGLKIDYVASNDKEKKGGHAFCRVRLKDECYKLEGEWAADPTADSAQVGKPYVGIRYGKIRNTEFAYTSAFIPPKQLGVNYLKNEIFSRKDNKIITSEGYEFDTASNFIEYDVFERAYFNMQQKTREYELDNYKSASRKLTSQNSDDNNISNQKTNVGFWKHALSLSILKEARRSLKDKNK